MTEDWTKWQSLVINGVFPLRRFLGRSNHSVVFLTEYRERPAAIKLLPADPKLAESKLARWSTLAGLSHPHLIRLFESGHCQLGGQQFVFVVMDYAEQNLAQILPHRALTPEEVRELLLPTLDALAFLHGKNLVHGRLKPSNFLVVDDQLKLASDTIFSAGQPGASTARSSSTAGDIRGLGFVIVEALTQISPAPPAQGSEAIALPASLPPAYATIVRRCLTHFPASRPTIEELQSQVKALQEPPVSAPPPPAVREPPVREAAASESPVREPPVRDAAAREAAVREAAVREAAMRETPTREPPARAPAPREAAARAPSPRKSQARLFIAGFAGSLAVVAAIWVVVSLRSHPHAPPPATPAALGTPRPDPPPVQAAAPPPAAQSPKAPISGPAAVLHQETPDVPRSARESIRGHIKVVVRVNVDRTGNVVEETLEGRGSSKYFARLAADAATKWKFSRADDTASRVWLLQFDFSRAGTVVHASSPR